MPSNKRVSLPLKPQATIDTDPTASAADQALKTLQAKGVILLVHGGPYHANAAVLCDPRNSTDWVINALRTVLAKLEASQQADVPDPPGQVRH